MALPLLDLSERELRDTARLAVQSAAAAAAMFLGMQALDLPEKFVGVLSAVLVVQPSVGNTIGEAMGRFIATLVGSLVGLASLFLLPVGYGTAIALALSMLVMNAIAGIRPEWRYGVVAAVALSLGSEGEALVVAQERTVAIGGGALIGALASFVVWPDTATKRARRHLSSALQSTAICLDKAVDGAQNQAEIRMDRAKQRFHVNYRSAMQAAEGIQVGDQDSIIEQVKITERLYNSTLILNRVAKETDQAADGTNEYSDGIEQIRARCCQIVKSLADGDLEQDDSLALVEETLEQVHSAANESSEDPRERVLKNTLVFGLSEVKESLAALQKALRSEGEESST